VILLLFALTAVPLASPQTIATAASMKALLSVQPVDRISLPISNSHRIALPGQRYPLARTEYSIGRTAPDLYMGRMVLVLAPSTEQEAALEELIRAQHDPGSQFYQQWLTPEQFGKRFGISQHDLQQVTAWLKSFGMDVEEVPASRRTVVFNWNGGAGTKRVSCCHAQISDRWRDALRQCY